MIGTVWLIRLYVPRIGKCLVGQVASRGYFLDSEFGKSRILYLLGVAFKYLRTYHLSSVCMRGLYGGEGMKLPPGRRQFWGNGDFRPLFGDTIG